MNQWMGERGGREREKGHVERGERLKVELEALRHALREFEKDENVRERDCERGNTKLNCKEKVSIEEKGGRWNRKRER